MIEAELLVSNIPALPEIQEAARVQWNASHHSQNFHDTKERAKEVFMSSSLLTKALTVPFGIGLIAAEGYELSWKNENRLADIATERFMASGGEALADPARGVAAFTGKLEIAIGVGAVIALHKYKPAMDVIRQRYFSEYEEEPVREEGDEVQATAIEDESDLQQKRSALKSFAKVGKLWGLAVGTGAFGVTTLEDAAREEYSLPKNIGAATAAAGILAVNNAALAGGILWGIKTNTPFVSDGLRNLAEWLKTPVFVGGILGGGMAWKAHKERRRIKQKWAREEAEASQIAVEESQVPAVEMI